MRVNSGKARRRSKKREFREAKGRRGGRKNLLRTVKQTSGREPTLFAIVVFANAISDVCGSPV